MAAPVKNTCPDIDKVIKSINAAVKYANEGLKTFEKYSEPYELCRDILYEIDGIDGTLEDLRSANDALRTWGTELEEEVENAANYINELENKIEELKSENVSS